MTLSLELVAKFQHLLNIDSGIHYLNFRWLMTTATVNAYYNPKVNEMGETRESAKIWEG